MSYDDLMMLIQDKANSEAWLYTDRKGTWTLRADLNVTIRQVAREPEDYTLLTETWTQGLNHSYMLEFELFYGSSFVQTFWLAGVDEYRGYVPLPISPGSNLVKQEDYTFAQCLNFRGSLESYMQKCGFTVERD